MSVGPYRPVFSGLGEARQHLLRAQPLIEAAETELYQASLAFDLLTLEQLRAITEHRHRLGLAAVFCKLHGWPEVAP